MKLIVDISGLLTTSVTAWSIADDWDDFITTSVASALSLGGAHFVSSNLDSEIEIVRETSNYIQSLSNEEIYTILNDIDLKEQNINQDEAFKLTYNRK